MVFTFLDLSALMQVQRVVVNDVTVLIADYPLSHLGALLSEYDGDVSQVVERLECDGWSPLEIAQGVARP